MPENTLHIGHWQINVETGEQHSTLTNGSLNKDGLLLQRIDPMGIKLLQLLAKNRSELVSKETILDTLWPNTEVNEDALARCVSRVRKALGDNPRKPIFIETIPKRGYRLIASDGASIGTPISASISAQNKQSHENDTNNLVAYSNRRKLLITFSSFLSSTLAVYLTFVVISDKEMSSEKTSQHQEINILIEQANDYYHKVNRTDNEMAFTLYQQAAASSPTSAAAYAGMANAIVQRAIRLPTAEIKNSLAWEQMSLGRALADKRLFHPDRLSQLNKALALAEKSISLAPNNAKAHKAKGFTLSALNRLAEAKNSYHQALTYDPAAWDVLINIGDIEEISGQLMSALSYYRQAFTAMSEHPYTHGKPWRADLGASIGDKYKQLGEINEAEIWFRHVLSFAPFDLTATKGLASILQQNGEVSEKVRLCQEYLERIGQNACD